MFRRRMAIFAVVLSLTAVACGPETGGGGTGGGGASDPTPTPEIKTVAPTLETVAPSLDIAAIVARILADNKKMTLSEVTVTQPALFVSDVLPQAPDAATVRAYIDATIAHLDTVWTNWFELNGFVEPWTAITVIMPGEQFTSRCPDAAGASTFSSTYNNAFYCSIDPILNQPSNFGGIALPVETIGQMWTGDMFDQQVSDLKKVGDFAAAMLIAHEFGHHIQDELAKQANVPPPINPQSELIADCFAGVWTYAVFLDGYLEPGDIDEAFQAVGVIGDGSVTVRSHGTGTERQNAYLIGYNGSEANPLPGVPGNCIAAFWTAWGV